MLTQERLVKEGHAERVGDGLDDTISDVTWAWASSTESPPRETLRDSMRRTYAGDMSDYYPDDAELEAVFARFSVELNQ